MDRGDGTQKGQAATQAFGSEQHELKLGKSFEQNNDCGFHTIRYDFKPKSVDHSREATLDVGEGSEVSIKFPNVENKGPDSTVFGGSKRSYQKECVLIYDHRTGEFTLEKLSCNIQVKRQRQEGTSKAQQLAPKKPLKVPAKNSPNARSRKKETSTPTQSPAPPPADMKAERSPAPLPSPLAASELSPAPPTLPSMPSTAANKDAADSSDSYMSSSDNDDDHDDDNSSSSSSSGSSSSEEEEQVEKAPAPPPSRPKVENKVEHRSKPSPVQPSLFQLSEDLQLSESGSDSDSD